MNGRKVPTPWWYTARELVALALGHRGVGCDLVRPLKAPGFSRKRCYISYNSYIVHGRARPFASRAT
jgi:hypothetical protein